MPLLTITEDLSGIVTSMTTAFTVADIVSIAGVVVSASAGYVLIRYGITKIVGGVQKAFKRGRLTV